MTAKLNRPACIVMQDVTIRGYVVHRGDGQMSRAYPHYKITEASLKRLARILPDLNIILSREFVHWYTDGWFVQTKGGQ